MLPGRRDKPVFPFSPLRMNAWVALLLPFLIGPLVLLIIRRQGWTIVVGLALLADVVFWAIVARATIHRDRPRLLGAFALLNSICSRRQHC
jgi:multisubunit Na+/H+ antiporter MnhC subunit